MAALDIAFILLIFISMLIGAWRGFVYESLLLLSWIGAFLLAQYLAPEMAGLLAVFKSLDTPVRYAIGFVALFIVLAFVFGLVAALVSKAIRKLGLRPVDRALGMAFGLLRGAVLLVVVALFVQLAGMRTEPWWQASRAAPVLVAILADAAPLMPRDLQAYMRGERSVDVPGYFNHNP